MTETTQHVLRGGPKSIETTTYEIPDVVTSVVIPYVADEGDWEGMNMLKYKRTADGFEYDSVYQHNSLPEKPEVTTTPKRSSRWVKLWPFSIAYKRGYDDRMDDYWDEGGW